MKKLLALIVVAFALSLYAADITLTISPTPAQARGITLATASHNAANPEAAPLTERQFVIRKIDEVLNFLASQAKREDDGSRAKKYELLSPAQKAQVDAILNP